VKKLYILFLILFSSYLSAATVKLELRFAENKIKQGDVVSVTMVFDGTASQRLPLNKLVGETLGGHFYITSAKPFITKDNWNALESEASLIIVKVPETKPLSFRLGENDVMVSWNDVEFIPTEVPKEFFYGNFEIPSRAQILKWFLIFLGLLCLSYGGLKGKKHFEKKKALALRKRKLKDEIMSASEYSAVVDIWRNKAAILKEFPKLDSPFKELESVLFKYQFKPQQTEQEKSQVMSAYRDFINKSQGGFDGI
jgi:hypothetical protein